MRMRFGCDGNRSCQRQNGGRVAVVTEVMFGQPYVVITDSLRPGDLAQMGRVKIGVVRLPLARIAERIPQAKLHTL